ncbi:esterase-like activity of phytase family protein [Pollutimonas bauzanensis]|uniref:esterase-like activity of phytase family protein n=1 Tax=Pollutimonas bauzanensis TaxID=658167 RepID=UPI0033418C7D
MTLLCSICGRHIHAILAVAISALTLTISPTAGARQGQSVQTLRFIGEQQIPHKQLFQHTTVGGLSGIDYDARVDAWILVSDDRSDFNVARFYTATLTYDAQSFSSVALTTVTPFRQPNGESYSSRWKSGEIADVEAVRFDPMDNSIWYTSEGERLRGLNPFIRRALRSGEFIEELIAPPMFSMRRGQKVGSRNNLTFEGMTFARDGQSLWVAMEGPIWQDGSVPTSSAGAMARITQYSRGGQMLRQVAYPIDAIPGVPASGKFGDNGVTEILAVDDERFLIAERAAVQNAAGQYSNFIRIYEIETSGATDVSGVVSLMSAGFQPVTKRLVLDLATLGLPKLDNIEGMAWGPKLGNGHDSLVLVSDDNFNASQVTQFLAFEVLLQRPLLCRLMH